MLRIAPRFVVLDHHRVALYRALDCGVPGDVDIPLRTIADLTAVTACITLNILTTVGILSAGSEIADFAVKMGSALLAMILTLIAGGDVRKMLQKEVQSG